MRYVLLIDDQPVQLRAREAVLQGAGFQVLTATEAPVALAILRDWGQRIGVVVTDHIMPGVRGTELVRRLRQHNPAMAVVVLSGMPEAAAEYEGLQVTFRAKPIPAGELIALVQNSLPADPDEVESA